MLKDRRALIEDKLRMLRSDAQSCYLFAVLGQESKIDKHNIKQLDALREEIMDLEFDLKMINELIDQGHK